MKIEKYSFKRHYVKSYNKWQYKVAKLAKLTLKESFYVELDFFTNGDIKCGDVVRFDNHLQARIEEKIGDKCKCFFFTEIPVNEFDYVFNSVYVIARMFNEY